MVGRLEGKEGRVELHTASGRRCAAASAAVCEWLEGKVRGGTGCDATVGIW